MTLRNVMTLGLMVAGFATMAQAQEFYGPRPVLRERAILQQRVEIDRRIVAHERAELRYAPGYAVGHEVRELRAAQARLNCDRQALYGVYGRPRY